MKLQDFISETLKEIIDGVDAVKGHYKEKGGSINSSDFILWEKQDIYYIKTGDLANTPHPVQSVEFDVEVTASEGSETKGGIGVLVGSFGAGLKGKKGAANTLSNRIKFSIPVALFKLRTAMSN
jgi:hypothetical protein